jgi:transposase
MQQDIITVGVDLAKNVFQVHAVGAEGKIVVRRQVRRAEMLKFFAQLRPCLIGMEACASAHHWARELKALGHEVRLMPPAYVKPYVKRGKTDAADAEAICEAVTRPTMRFVAVKSIEQQAVLMLHKTRDLLVRKRWGGRPPTASTCQGSGVMNRCDGGIHGRGERHRDRPGEARVPAARC